MVTPPLFDLVVGVILLVGLMRGRKRGMSQELIDLFIWIGIVIGGAYAYRPGGAYLAQWSGWQLLYCHLTVYILTGCLIFGAGSMIKTALRDKIAGTDLFGRLEYPLGMLSGIVRFACIILVLISLIHARQISAAEREAANLQHKKELGNQFWPSFGDIQVGIFQESYTGRFVKQKLNVLLMQSSSLPDEPAEKAAAPTVKKERDFEKVMGK